MSAIVASLVMRRQRTTVVAEHPTAARATALPGPDAVDAGQGLAFRIPLAVKKVCLKLTGGRVIPNDLEAANTDGSDSAVRGMHDEVAARRPLIDVARDDGLRWSVISWDGLTLCQPAADEHVQWFQLKNRRGDHHASPENFVALCCFVADVQSSWPYQPKQQNQEGSTAQDTPHGVKTPPAAQQLRCFLTAGVESWIDQLMIRRQHDDEREWPDGADKDRSRGQPDVAV